MRKVTWAEKRTGDVIFVYDPTTLLGIGIAAAERALLPGQDFYPSHAAIVGFDNTVVESIIERSENSVAAVNPISEYDKLAAWGNNVEVWRPEGTDEQKLVTLQNYINQYQSKPYGFLDLFGFLYEAIVKWLTGKTVGNPIEISYVCSEGVLLYLRALAQETDQVSGPLRWVFSLKISNCYPALLRQACVEHSSSAVAAA